jgi:hypothetical protein
LKWPFRGGTARTRDRQREMTSASEHARRFGWLGQSPRDLLKLARLLLLLAPWLFIAYLIWHERAALDVAVDASPARLAAAFGLLFAAQIVTAALWILLVRHLNPPLRHPGTLHLARAFARGWLARYIPGTVWAYSARVLNAGSQQVSVHTVARSLVGETGLVIGSATAVGLGLWAWSLIGPVPGLLVLAAGLALVTVSSVKLDGLARALFKALNKKNGAPDSISGEQEARDNDRRLQMRAAFGLSAGYATVNLLLSAGFVLAASSMVDVAGSDVPLLMAGYTLAGVAGLLVVFAPAGLGVREAVLVAIVASVLTVSIAASVAVIVRLLTVLADVLLFAAAEVLFRTGKTSSVGGQHGASR